MEEGFYEIKFTSGIKIHGRSIYDIKRILDKYGAKNVLIFNQVCMAHPDSFIEMLMMQIDVGDKVGISISNYSEVNMKKMTKELSKLFCEDKFDYIYGNWDFDRGN